MVRKFYRDLPYHNWDHAFSVAQYMFAVLQLVWDRFDPLHIVAMFFGCVCHDLDHRGRNNQFMKTTNHPLAILYPESTMERHHIYMTKFILESPQCNFLELLDEPDFQQVLTLMEDAILATDLLLWFSHKEEMVKVVSTGKLDWNNQSHKLGISRIMMTVCDLNAVCKPWEMQKTNATKVFQEFFDQSLEEVGLGIKPNQMMSDKSMLPQSQVGFINAVVRPCLSIALKVIPELMPAYEQLSINLQEWEEIVKSKEMIEQLRVPGSILQERSLSFIRYDRASRTGLLP